MVVLRAIGRFIRNVAVGAPISHDETLASRHAESERIRMSELPGANLAAHHANGTMGQYPF
jgi:hypothetical protein